MKSFKIFVVVLSLFSVVTAADNEKSATNMLSTVYNYTVAPVDKAAEYLDNKVVAGINCVKNAVTNSYTTSAYNFVTTRPFTTTTVVAAVAAVSMYAYNAFNEDNNKKARN